MKKAFALLSVALLCGAMTAYAQRPTTKTISATRLADVSERAETVESFALEASYEMFVTPVLADIKLIDANAQGECKHRYFQGANRSDGQSGKQYLLPKQMQGKNVFFDFETLKGQVIFDFCRETEADVIVMPQFSVRHATYKRDGVLADGTPYRAGDPIEDGDCFVMEVEMLGFPAVYTKFRSAQKSDYWIKESLFAGQKDNDRTLRSVEEVSSQK